MRKDYIKIGRIFALAMIVLFCIIAKLVTNVDEMLYLMLMVVILLLIIIVSVVLTIKNDVSYLVSQAESKEKGNEGISK